MGNFYVNFTTRGPDQAAVAQFLRSAKRRAFVGPTLGGLTVFFDEKSDTQNESEIKALGGGASRDLNAPVFAVLNHDDDILAYWLFEAGKLADEYNSSPGYFTDGDNTPSGGDADKLCAAFAVATKAREVKDILHNKEYLFALERHEALAGLLNLPWAYACMGYRYIKTDPLDEGISAGDLIRIG